MINLRDQLGVPIRCTQNPTIGEEWKRKWHPEILPEKKSNDSFLIIGAGPSGLEAAHALGKRGHEVILSEEKIEIGGRALLESKLPSLNAWIRVRDYRQQQFLKLQNVKVYTNSKLETEDILNSEADRIIFATGSKWRSDGFGRSNTQPIKKLNNKKNTYSPDDIMHGIIPSGNIAIFDDDYYYLGPNS